MTIQTEPTCLRLLDDDGSLLGQVDFTASAEVGEITRVEVSESARGQGLAAQLTEAAVYEIMGRGLQVAASCSYAKNWLTKHPQFPTADDPQALPDATQSIFTRLTALEGLARSDQSLRQALIATRKSTDPLGDFCRLSAEAGIPMTPAEVVNAGEVAYAETRRATNGGGENSPGLEGEDDAYEMFILAIQ